MSIIELRVAGRYRLKQKIGSGSFGDIYLGILDPICLTELAQNVQTFEEVAVKMVKNGKMRLKRIGR
jgi:hypothetical protein